MRISLILLKSFLIISSVLLSINNIIPAYHSNKSFEFKRDFPSLKDTAIIDTSIYQDIRGDNIFVFNIHPHLSSFRFVLVGDPENYWVDEIRIYKGNDSLPFQIINDEDELMSEPPVKGERYFFTGDFNFDGYEDIAFLKFWGATGNRIYCIWLYDKSKNIFESNDFFKNIYSPSLDYKKKQLTTFEKYGGAGEYQYDTYQFSNNKYMLVNEEKYWIKNGKNNYYQMKDVLEMVNDTLKLISRDTLETY
jgi:hypothetical protein